MQYRRLPLDRLEQFEGAGVSYAATELEARHVQGRAAVVIGGGNSAGQAAMFLSRRAERVHLVVRGTSLAASMSDYLIERIRKNDAISLHFGAEVTGLHGEETLSGVTLREAGAEHLLEAAGLFVMVGAAPNTGWLSGLVDLDPKGFVLTADGYATSCPGIFAVGDVRAGSVKARRLVGGRRLGRDLEGVGACGRRAGPPPPPERRAYGPGALRRSGDFCPAVSSFTEVTSASRSMRKWR